MKKIVQGLDTEGDAFQYLKKIFPKLIDAKLKEGIFVGPHIRKVLWDEKFDQKLSVVELAAWRPFKRIVSKLLGSKKVENYLLILSFIYNPLSPSENASHEEALVILKEFFTKT